MKRAVVLLSGGLDSATVLAIAQEQGYSCYALSVDYGQRHRAELDAAAHVAKALGAVEHRTLRIDLGGIGGSALTDSSIAVPESPQIGIPVTYVPARNTVMLVVRARLGRGSQRASHLHRRECRRLLRLSRLPAGVRRGLRACREPRDEGGRGGHAEVRDRAPLIDLTKAQIIRRGLELGVDFSLTVSCYQADAQGRACGRCDSCRLRREGFKSAGLPDPTRYVQ